MRPDCFRSVRAPAIGPPGEDDAPGQSRIQHRAPGLTDRRSPWCPPSRFGGTRDVQRTPPQVLTDKTPISAHLTRLSGLSLQVEALRRERDPRPLDRGVSWSVASVPVGPWTLPATEGERQPSVSAGHMPRSL